MAKPAKLLALASGRLPPASRTALAVGLGGFVAVLVLVHPVHQPTHPLRLESPSVLSLGTRSVWVDRALLEDTGATYFPKTTARELGLDDAAQPDAAPFSLYGPDLRQASDRTLGLAVDGASGRKLAWDAAFPLADDEPYLTLGSRAPRLVAEPRLAKVVASQESAQVVAKTWILTLNDGLNFPRKNLSGKDLRFESTLEISLGVDNFGLEAPPCLVRSSGNPETDAAVLVWAKGLTWTKWLKPGSYRIGISP